VKAARHVLAQEEELREAVVLRGAKGCGQRLDPGGVKPQVARMPLRVRARHVERHVAGLNRRQFTGVKCSRPAAKSKSGPGRAWPASFVAAA